MKRDRRLQLLVDFRVNVVAFDELGEYGHLFGDLGVLLVERGEDGRERAGGE